MESKTIYEIPYDDCLFRLVCHDEQNVTLYQIMDDKCSPPMDVKSVTKSGDDLLVTMSSGHFVVL